MSSSRILLIEDNPGDARLIEEYLSDSTGNVFHIERAVRLAEGLERLEPGEIDLILLDLTLPDSSGLETFSRVNKQASSLPIIVLTGLDDEDLAIRAVREGAQDYLLKSELDSNLLVRACRYAIERNRVDRALRESEERYALSALGANDGLWDWNFKTNEIYFSPRWKAILGYEDGDFESNPKAWLSCIHPEDIGKFRTQLQAHKEGTLSHLECEYRMRHKDGSYRWVLTRGLAVRDVQEEAYRIAGSQTDITDRKQTEEQLRRLAIYDSLTNLPNRSLFMDRLERAVERARRGDEDNFAVLFLDIDQFRKINERFGRTVGDQLLLTFANRMRDIIRAEDTLARLEVDDFVLLQENVSRPNEVLGLADQILSALKSPFKHNGHEIFLNVNIGIVVHKTEFERAEDVLRDAEIAMYRAKSKPNEPYMLFDTLMHTHDIARYQVEDELRQAIEGEEFLLHYQPIISLVTGELVGFEALLRWQHPKRGLVPPGEFIPLTESTGLIIPIGQWVMRTACQQLMIWQEQFPTDPPRTMSVNLSSIQFSQRDLTSKTRTILDELGLNGQQLHLEITERAMMDPSPVAVATLLGLQSLGIHIHLDDFGTGYSSLGYLNQLPIDAIKVDRSFINLEADGKNPKIVRTIIRLAHELEIDAIAEGVETPNQLNQLTELGCAYAQGFLFSRPLDPKDMTTLLSQGFSAQLQPIKRRKRVREITDKWFGR